MFAARFDPSVFAVQAEEAKIPKNGDINEKKRKAEESEPDTSSDESDERAEEEEDNKFTSDEDLKSDSEDSSSEDIEDETAHAPTEEDPMDIDESLVVPDKHSSVFKRFQKSIFKANAAQLQTTSKDDKENEDDVELNDIAPLPQPSLPKDKKLSSLASLNSNLDWLTQPIYYQTDLVKPFNELQPTISPLIVNNLEWHFNIKTAFSVQISVIETLMKDIKKNEISSKFQGDLLVNASTGSGKTLAYAVPVVQALMDRVVPKLRCIILVPTKPLIQQVRATLFNLSKGINLNIMTFKNDVSIKEELDKYISTKPDIIISTPGRLVEHLPSLDLTYLRYLIIDEADRLLNQSFQNWCDLLIDKLSAQQNFNRDQWHLQCSKLIFSATLTTNAEKLSHLKLEEPRLIIVNNQNELVNEMYQLPIKLKECYIRFYTGLSSEKPLILYKFLTSYQGIDEENNVFKFNRNVLIFTKSTEASLRLTRLLSLISERFHANLNIASINSSLKNQERQRLLKKFDTGEIDILISTDLISRGIDLTSVHSVINYDLPLSTKEYIHRIGRTARANKFGYAINFMFGKGEWRFMSSQCLFNKVVNRNNREAREIDVLRKPREVSEHDKEPGFVLEMEEFEKRIYTDCLQELKEEVYNGNGNGNTHIN